MSNLCRAAGLMAAALWATAVFAQNTAVIPAPRSFPTNWM